tara:strand:+ start:300 stop:1202 length:903 start_codon:yes stop_codon:yes gene_type:complete
MMQEQEISPGRVKHLPGLSCFALLSLVLWCLITGAAAQAQSRGAPGRDRESSPPDGKPFFEDMPLPKVSEIMVGGGLKYAPDYIGSDDYKIHPKLALVVRFKDVLTLDEDGAAINILGVGKFAFGPVLHVTAGRDGDVNPALRGLEDIELSLDFGLFAQLTIADRFTGRVRYFGDIIGGDNGRVFEFSVQTDVYQRDNFLVTMKVSADLVDEKRARQFFGISPQQAAVSGLPVHRPKGRIQDGRAELKAHWKFADRWSLVTYTRYARLLGDFAASPIVDPAGSPHQFILGSYITYTFAMK